MNKSIKTLEKFFLEELSEMTIGDADATKQLKISGCPEGMELENILISIFNLLKVDQYRIKKLESNLKLLAYRIYNPIEDFTEEEKEELKEVLSCLETDDLLDIGNTGLDDLFFINNKESFEVINQKKDILLNKIDYPTQTMHTTYHKLINDEIELRSKMK